MGVVLLLRRAGSFMYLREGFSSIIFLSILWIIYINPYLGTIYGWMMITMMQSMEKLY